MAVSNPSAFTVASLLPKLSDADPDYRFMSLNDLYTVLSNGHQSFMQQEYSIAARTVDGVLKTLDDPNGEVQNLAIKCLGPLVLKVPPNVMLPLVEKLANLTTEHSVDSSISATAIRTVVTTLPRPVPGVPHPRAVEDAYTAVSRILIPRLVGHVVVPTGTKHPPELPLALLAVSSDRSIDADSIDVLIEIVRCFGPMLQAQEVRGLEKALTAILEHDRPGSVVKKRAVVAISVLAVHFSDDQLSAFVSRLIELFRNPHLTPAKQRLFISLLGSMARSIPQRLGPYLKTLAPFVLSAVSQAEMKEQLDNAAEDGEPDLQTDELRETALATLDACLAACGDEMRSFNRDLVNAALRWLRYDPNVTEDIEDEEMDGAGDDDGEADDVLDQEDDFEEEGGFDDDDDISWKVRRCAAKVLHTLIHNRGHGDLLEDGTAYDQIAPVLIDRFNEREENVRLEVLMAMGALIRRTGDEESIIPPSPSLEGQMPFADQPFSRKRRRGGSDASMLDSNSGPNPRRSTLTSPLTPSIPASGPRANLAKLTPVIVRSIKRLLQSSSLATKQASISLLRDIVQAQGGGLAEYLSQLIDPVVDIIKSKGHFSGNATAASTMGGAATATGNSVRIEALRFTAAVAETHPTSVLLPYLPKLVPAVVSAVQDPFYKVSSEALLIVEQLVKVVTPPRATGSTLTLETFVHQLYDVIVDRVGASAADLEVRQRGIHALGVLLARTTGSEGSKYLVLSQRWQGLEVLHDRMRNEVTRITAVRAVDVIASYSQTQADFKAPWVRAVALEIAGQLRKANRSVRGSSLTALKTLVLSPAGRSNLDDGTIMQLVAHLEPLLTADDLHLLAPTLVVLTNLVAGHAAKVVTPEVTSSLCSLVLAPLGDTVLEALLALVKTIGEESVGQGLMQGLLKDVGVNGDPTVVGKIIGTLVVFGGNSVGVQIADFEAELETAQDDQRKCLALSVLGEAGLRRGSSSPLKPTLFLRYFQSKSDQVPLAAAVALGRAGASNVAEFLPVMLQQLKTTGSMQYLLLHSFKELLQQAEPSALPRSARSQELWEQLFVAAQAEDNRAIGAECVGRLALLDPKTYLPLLQRHLKDGKAAVRGVVIQAVRFTLTDADAPYDDLLRPVLVDMLMSMLDDGDLENRRLAMTTLNSAAHNKAALVLPHLGRLLPLVIQESKVKPELVRTVQMGPFKHKVDDGLEVRKSAYETLFALMDTQFTRSNIGAFYDRVIAGLGDEHDIRVLCNLMLTKLLVLDPDETLRRLDSIADHFRAILSHKPKENAVKQEIEKAEEASNGVLRVSMRLHRRFPTAGATIASGQHQNWQSYWEWMRKEFGSQLKRLED